VNFNLDLMLPYKDEVKAAVNRVIDSGQYIYGPELAAFERSFMGKARGVGVGNGTDALRIALLALGVRPGDEVISPAFNVGYTALAVSAVGAKNVFVDVDEERLLMDVDMMEDAITSKTKAIIPVHMYGRMCNMPTIQRIARCYGDDIRILEDAAQVHGGGYMHYAPELQEKEFVSVGTHSDAAAFSFYPTKNLGALGEAGAITTDIPEVEAEARLLRNAGRSDRYAHIRFGINSGLDEIQAAILQVKLKYLIERNMARQAAASYYDDHLPVIVRTKRLPWDVCHLYVIRTPLREELHNFLTSRGIPSLIHYPLPVPHQPIYCEAYAAERRANLWPVTTRAAREVLSLPMHADITKEDQDAVIKAVKDFFA
jgi:dTDP-4-amino-4,6-dideoxygalactose transaminase